MDVVIDYNRIYMYDLNVKNVKTTQTIVCYYMKKTHKPTT